MKQKKMLGAFTRNQDGATAVEFAIVAMAFLMLFMGIIEYGMFMMTQVAIESAVAQGGRLASIGASSAGCDRACNVQKVIKDKTSGFVNASALVVSANKVSSGGTSAPDICIDNPNNPNSNIPSNLPPPATPNCKSWVEVNGINNYQGVDGTNVGSAGDIIEIRASYPWKVLFPVLGEFIGQNGIVMISSSTVVKNEQFNN